MRAVRRLLRRWTRRRRGRGVRTPPVIRRALQVLPAVIGLLLSACGDVMSPLRKLGEPGKDPYLVFVAQSPDHFSDLYVSRPDGKDIRPVTFSPTWESRPHLSEDGATLAFLRSVDTAQATPRQVWVTNLLNGTERKLELGAGPVVRDLAWSADGAQVFARLDDGSVLAWQMPPREKSPGVPLSGAARDSALARFDVLLGDPPFARVVRCTDGQPWDCVTAFADSTHARQPIADVNVREATRWRGDSVGYLILDSLRVRPLTSGRERRVEWGPTTPIHPREFTLFPGRR